jgi:hypothetical protein
VLPARVRRRVQTEYDRYPQTALDLGAVLLPEAQLSPSLPTGAALRLRVLLP